LKIINRTLIEKPDPKTLFRRDLSGKTNRTAIENLHTDPDCKFSGTL
jgi:hypothetical protein